jgi:hypothetical protein
MLEQCCQVRAFGETALETLLKAGASATGAPPVLNRDIDGEVQIAYDVLLTHLPENLCLPSPASPNGPRSPKHELLQSTLSFGASLVAELVHKRIFQDADAWKRCLTQYVTPWTEEDTASAFTESVRGHFKAIDQVKSDFTISRSKLIKTFSVQVCCCIKRCRIRRGSTMRYPFLIGIWSSASPIAYNIEAYTWSAIRHPRYQWLREIYSHAPTA